MAIALRRNRSLHALVALGTATVLCALFATSMVASAPVAFKPTAPPMARRGVASDEIPASLRQVAPGMLGRANVSSWLRPVAGGFEGINPAQRLRLRSEASGIELTNEGSGRVRLTLAAGSRTWIYRLGGGGRTLYWTKAGKRCQRRSIEIAANTLPRTGIHTEY